MLLLLEFIGVVERWSVGPTPVNPILISIDGTFSETGDLSWTRVIRCIKERLRTKGQGMWATARRGLENRNSHLIAT
jgi:hypothetical protein